MKVKSESEVAQPCPTLSDPMGCSQPGSSVHGIFQARVLEWDAIDKRLLLIQATVCQHNGQPGRNGQILRYGLLRLNQEEIENMNRPATSTETKFDLKTPNRASLVAHG